MVDQLHFFSVYNIEKVGIGMARGYRSERLGGGGCQLLAGLVSRICL